MGSRYERYIFRMCTMKIVAKLINFEQIQPNKNKDFKHFLLHKIKTLKYENNRFCSCLIKLMKGKALREHSLHEKTAASVLLKLFISGNE